MIYFKELDLILQLVLLNYHGVVWNLSSRKCPSSRQREVEREPLVPSAQRSALSIIPSHPTSVSLRCHAHAIPATNQDEDVCGALQVYRLLARQG